MKTNFFAVIAISFVLMTTGVNAQLHSTASVVASKSTFTATANDTLTVSNSFASLKRNPMFLKANKSFQKQFQPTGDITWFEHKDSITVSFLENEISTKVVYDNDGRWMRTTRYYNEDKLSAASNLLIKARFPNYTIICIQEMTDSKKTSLIAHLESGSIYRKVIVKEEDSTICYSPNKKD